MDTHVYSRILENRMIRRFQDEFFSKTGKHLQIKQTDLPYEVLPLEELKELFDEMLPHPYTCISEKSRKKEIVYVRMLYCNIAYGMGYSLKQIARMIDRDHSTIYNAIEVIDDLMESKEPFVTELYNTAVAHLKNHPMNGTIISAVHGAPDHSEPAVSAVLL